VIEYVDRSFADCENHWAKKAIEALAARGVIEGTSISTFEPNETITRADFVTLLSRYFSLTGDSVKSFADVEEDQYYSRPIAMFKAMGVLPPTESGMFKPNEPITRQDLMYILNMVLTRTNVDVEDKGFSVAGFNDFDQAAEYAVESIKYLVSRDVIHGYDNAINPTGTATRAEIAQVLFNMMELLRK
jgi:beta-glucosidase